MHLPTKLLSTPGPDLSPRVRKSHVTWESHWPMHRARERQEDEARGWGGASTLQNHSIQRQLTQARLPHT